MLCVHADPLTLSRCTHNFFPVSQQIGGPSLIGWKSTLQSTQREPVGNPLEYLMVPPVFVKGQQKLQYLY